MLDELLADLFASLAPGPETDRGRLIASLVAGSVGVLAPLSFPLLIEYGIVTAHAVTFLLAASSLASATALVVGVLYLFRRSTGAALPIACTVLGITGFYVAWTLSYPT